MPPTGPTITARFQQDLPITFDLTLNKQPLPPSTVDELWLAAGHLGANSETLSTVLLRKRLSVEGEVTVVDDANGRVTFNITSTDLSADGALNKPYTYHYDVWVTIGGKDYPMTTPAALKVLPGVGP